LWICARDRQAGEHPFVNGRTFERAIRQRTLALRVRARGADASDRSSPTGGGKAPVFAGAVHGSGQDAGLVLSQRAVERLRLAPANSNHATAGSARIPSSIARVNPSRARRTRSRSASGGRDGRVRRRVGQLLGASTPPTSRTPASSCRAVGPTPARRPPPGNGGPPRPRAGAGRPASCRRGAPAAGSGAQPLEELEIEHDVVARPAPARPRRGRERRRRDPVAVHEGDPLAGRELHQADAAQAGGRAPRPGRRRRRSRGRSRASRPPAGRGARPSPPRESSAARTRRGNLVPNGLSSFPSFFSCCGTF
jgi:hypothetical protein